MKWDILATILRNHCLHEIIQYIRLSKNKSLLKKLLQQKYSNIRFTRCVKTFNHQNRLSCILQLTDGRILTGSNTLCIWDSHTFELLKTIDSSKDISHILQINEVTLVTASYKHKLDFWKIENGNIEMVAQFNTTASVYCMVQIDCNTLAYGGKTRNISIIDVHKRKTVHSLQSSEHRGTVAMVKMNDHLITGGDVGVIFLRDINNNFLLLKKISGGKQIISIVKVNKKLFAAGYSDSKIILYELLLGDIKVIRTLDVYFFSQAHSLAVLKDGRLVAGNGDGEIIIWDSTYKVECILASKSCNSVNQIIQLKDGRIVSISDYNDVWS
jgi:WD40 repeat protein